MSKPLTPQIRFKGFEEDWQLLNLEDSFSLIAFKPFIASPKPSGLYPVIQQGNNPISGYSDEIPCQNYQNAIVLGDHTLSVYKPSTPFLVASDGVKILISNKLSGSFFYFYLNRYKPITEGYKRHFSILVEKQGFAPDSIEEEKRIAGFLSNIDVLIGEVEREIMRLKKMKLASLQKMFPRPDATTPEVRFAGFSNPWCIKHIGNIFSEGNARGCDGLPLSVSIVRGVYPTEDFIKTVTVKDFTNYKKVADGDIVYNSMRMWQGASGVSYWNGFVSPAYTVLCPIEKENICSEFFAYLFKLEWVIKIFEANSQGLTKDTWNLKYPAISLIALPTPSDVEEQRAIAHYFRNLDELITAKRQKLAKLRNLKTSCLDKMFVSTSEL